MSTLNITFDGFDLQNDIYTTTNVNYRHLAEKVIDTKPRPRTGGFDVVDSYYTQKVITLRGWIRADSEGALRTARDNLFKALRGAEKNLDIDYGTEVLRYKATVSRIDVPEESFHINRLPFTIEFLALPWATKTTSSQDSKSITSSPYSNSIDVGGTFGPFPVLKWTVSGTPGAAITKIKFENTTTGDWIEVDDLNLAADGDYLEIDCENMTVKENATSKDFDGVFPEFEPGTNNYTVTITGGGGSFTLNQTITYYETFL